MNCEEEERREDEEEKSAVAFFALVFMNIPVIKKLPAKAKKRKT